MQPSANTAEWHSDGSRPAARHASGVLTLGASAGGQLVVGGDSEYGVDLDASGTIDQVFPFPTHGSNPPGNLAVGWDPTGALAGLRCPTTGVTGLDCSLELARDTDADSDLADETGVVLEVLTNFSRLNAPSLSFDGSGNPVLGYIRRQFDNRATVAHDRDGDGVFTGSNERVVVESFADQERRNGEVAVDPNGRPAYVFFNPSDDVLRVAYDRSGDGDFDDTVGGNPELFTLAAESAIACLGAAFDGSGRLAVVWGNGATGPQLARDLNADGDFADRGEVVELSPAAATACDVAGAPAPIAGVAVVHDAGASELLIDRNDDGDYDDADESVSLSGLGDQVELRWSDAHGAHVIATETTLFVP
jgi:hypothetical protein